MHQLWASCLSRARRCRRRFQRDSEGMFILPVQRIDSRHARTLSERLQTDQGFASFPANKPLPKTLVRKLIETRMTEERQ